MRTPHSLIYRDLFFPGYLCNATNDLQLLLLLLLLLMLSTIESCGWYLLCFFFNVTNRTDLSTTPPASVTPRRPSGTYDGRRLGSHPKTTPRSRQRSTNRPCVPSRAPSGRLRSTDLIPGLATRTACTSTSTRRPIPPAYLCWCGFVCKAPFFFFFCHLALPRLAVSSIGGWLVRSDSVEICMHMHMHMQTNMCTDNICLH